MCSIVTSGFGYVRHVGRVRVVPLAGEDGGQALAPRLLDRGEDPHLVVDQHVVVGRVASLDVVELELLVDVDEHAPGRRLAQAGAFDLQRLKHDVAVGQDDGGPEATGVRDGVQRAGVEPLRERVIRPGTTTRSAGGDRAGARLAVALQRPEDSPSSRARCAVARRSPVALVALPNPTSRTRCCLRSTMTRSLSSSVLSTSNRKIMSTLRCSFDGGVPAAGVSGEAERVGRSPRAG